MGDARSLDNGSHEVVARVTNCVSQPGPAQCSAHEVFSQVSIVFCPGPCALTLHLIQVSSFPLTVDTGNLAPPRIPEILSSLGYRVHKVVQDFLHPQYKPCSSGIYALCSRLA